MDIYHFVAIPLILFFSVIIHECAHGWVAYRLGDPTAKLAGRLTLNPLPHIDFIGTIAVPALLIWIKSPIILGWAKPVPVNFAALHHPKRDMIWVGLAGPLVNIALAVVASVLLRTNLPGYIPPLLEVCILINLILAIFNLMPIPPLDGSRLVMGILPYSLARAYARLERYGMVIIFLLLYFRVLDHILWPLVRIFGQLLGI